MPNVKLRKEQVKETCLNNTKEIQLSFYIVQS